MQSKRLLESRVHFIGVGGIGMSGLAELLKNMGADVSGSDLGENAQTDRLKKIGVTVYKGHNGSYVDGCDVVVYTSAVKEDNLEFQRAKELKIPLIRRAEALAEIMLMKKGLAIAGTHGKTTTTSLTASVFIEAKVDPTIVVGGRLDLIKSTASLGQGDWLIAEADESDGSFTRLSPEVVIVTNIDNDHLDHYKDFENLKMAFYDFASRIPFYGQLIYCGDDSVCRELFEQFPKKKVSYGFDKSNDYYLEGSCSQYKIYHNEKLLGEIKLALPGKHNALNSLAALVSGLEQGFSFEDCAQAVANFKGVDRRFQHKASVNDVDYYDDYAHHPTELKAVLQAFREKFPHRKLKVVFQPHRYSRTKECWDDFKDCFVDADELYILDIYPAGEKPIVGVSAKELLADINCDNKSYAPLSDSGLEKIKEEIRPSDVVILLGAGNIYRWGEGLYT